MDNILATDLNTEQKILEAARKVFVRKGFSGARMQEIADEAGINKALLHYYFRSKEKLFDEIFRDAFGRLLPQLTGIFMLPISLFEKIERFTDSYISLVFEQPFIPVFVLSEIHRSPDDFFTTYVQPELLSNIRKIGEEFKKAADDGLIKAIDPRQLMMNIMSLCVFPFVARPMLQRMLQLPDKAYETLLQQRRKEVSNFVISAITP
jgi:TetR/AcrR family transcriptional regulator